MANEQPTIKAIPYDPVDPYSSAVAAFLTAYHSAREDANGGERANPGCGGMSEQEYYVLTRMAALLEELDPACDVRAWLPPTETHVVSPFWIEAEAERKKGED